jgi:HEAT repeat protein
MFVQATRDSDETVRSAAIYGLGNLRTPEARDTLLELTRGGGATTMRRDAISMLRRFDDPAAKKRLVELFRDSDPTIAMTAIQSTHGEADAMDALRSVARDPRSVNDVRTTAASMLRAYGELDEDTDAQVNRLYEETYHYESHASSDAYSE